VSDGVRHPFETAPPEGGVTKVAPGILWLRLPLPMALDHVNIYALDDGDGWTIVDAGLSSRRSKAIWEGLLAGPLGGKPVTRVILTHHHPDHVGLVGWFQARGAELLATRTAWLYARMLTLDVQDRPTAEALETYRRAVRPSVPSTLPISSTRCRLALPGWQSAGGCMRRAGTGRSGWGRAMRPTMRRSGPMTGSSWAETSFCPASRPISASTQPSPRPTR
jgi:hypothetical protein